MIDLTRNIFFNEKLHRYTDNLANVYTSSTTLIGKYYNKFDTKARSRDCHLAGKRGNLKYRTPDGKRALTQQEIINKWDKARDVACDKGNSKHNYLETRIKATSLYKNAVKQFVDRPDGERLYTIDDIAKEHNFGLLSIQDFAKTGIKDKYPVIYNSIQHLVNQGYRLYAEICVYDAVSLVSGLIDLLLVNPETNSFMILDWKTNIDDFTYVAGYYVKDANGNRTTQFKESSEYFKHPISHLQASNGNKYGLQLSLYAFLTEQWGLKLEKIILCHIRDFPYTERVLNKRNLSLDYVGLETVDFHEIKYLKDEVVKVIKHHYDTTTGNTRKTQLNLGL